jgi:hypothetical protein
VARIPWEQAEMEPGDYLELVVDNLAGDIKEMADTKTSVSGKSMIVVRKKLRDIIGHLETVEQVRDDYSCPVCNEPGGH